MKLFNIWHNLHFFFRNKITVYTVLWDEQGDDDDHEHLLGQVIIMIVVQKRKKKCISRLNLSADKVFSFQVTNENINRLNKNDFLLINSIPLETF